MDTQSVITAEAWPISPSLLVAILAAVALVVSTSLLSFLRRRSPLPPGPSPWPILGNLPQLGLLPHRALAKLADRYGPIMTIWFGSTPTLIVSSPEVACDVMKTNDKLCSSRPVLKTVAIFSLDGQNIAFSPDNDHWRKMRRLATLHLLSAKKLQESLPVREEEIRGMLDAIAVDAATTADVTKGGKPAAPADDGIEVRRYLTRATLNNILRLTVGKRFCYSSIRGAADVSSKAILEAAMKIDWNERIAAITGEKCGGIRGDAAEAAAAPATGSAAEKKEGEMLIALIEEGFSLAGSFNLADYVPWLGAGGDPLGMYTRAKRATPQLHGFMRSCIEERRQLAARKEEKEFETTLVDVLLEMEGDGEDEINKTELLMLALDMMLAGTDSTSKTVEWTLAELVQHPDVLERLRAEVDAAYAKSASAAAETGAPGGESGLMVSLPVQEMPYLQAVLKEQFRHHPVTPLFFPRLTTGSVTLGGYNIPPNTMININYWALAHDPTVWINPHKFDPSRFLDPAAPDMLGQHFSLLPFGSGRRGCLGKTLGIDMSARLLANLVRRFDFELPEEARAAGGVDMTETLGLSMTLVKPLRLVVRERKAVAGPVVAAADA